MCIKKNENFTQIGNEQLFDTWMHPFVRKMSVVLQLVMCCMTLEGGLSDTLHNTYKTLPLYNCPTHRVSTKSILTRARCSVCLGCVIALVTNNRYE